MYGVNTVFNGVVHVSNTIKGAKTYATRNGYKEVYHISKYSWACTLISTKINDKWVDSK